MRIFHDFSPLMTRDCYNTSRSVTVSQRQCLQNRRRSASFGLAVAQSPQDRVTPPNAADADAVSFRGTSNSTAMIVPVPARPRMRLAQQLGGAHHSQASRDVGKANPPLNSAVVERRLRRADWRGTITHSHPILGQLGRLRLPPGYSLTGATRGDSSTRRW
jgi:hypothetical protein